LLHAVPKIIISRRKRIDKKKPFNPSVAGLFIIR
jgi:hypothetical protein